MRTLRKKIIAAAAVAIVCAMLLIGAAINAGLYVTSASRADSIIQALYDNGGEFPSAEAGKKPPDGFRLTEETPFETRYFTARVNADGDVESVDTEHIASVGRLDAAETAQRLASSGRSAGHEGEYRFGVFEDEGGSNSVHSSRQRCEILRGRWLHRGGRSLSQENGRARRPQSMRGPAAGGRPPYVRTLLAR